MKPSSIIPAILLTWFSAFGQGDYFQQEVNYVIDVTLDDNNHTLSGRIDIEYINRSPDRLDTLYFHLWPNAFRDQTTAFARQQLRMGRTGFYFAEKEDLGNISGLDFRAGGRPAAWSLTPKNPDIAVLVPESPVQSGDTILISTPFTVKIPASFSRLGRVGESYQITQWYPKPAVYDRDGWHPMPYLEMGEFYSEFGSFDVRITLPENYVVGATGVLQTESEKAFLEEKTRETDEYFKSWSASSSPIVDTDSFPASSPKMKTIRFTADNVHDFAWFADKRFRVRRSGVAMPSGRYVDTWVMFTQTEEELWKDAVQYVDRSVEFYSSLVGEYPWPQATAVQSALSAGGGMEYPMITVIGEMGDATALDEVITHEVGHNWFYGILAFDERTYPWMDEGINSYYEQRYMNRYYGRRVSFDLPKKFSGDSEMDIPEFIYLFQARRNLDQAPGSHSEAFSGINYMMGAYIKPALALYHLEEYLGADAFDRIMKSFYERWKFRHPGPQDFRRHFEAESGKDLGWLFDGFINSTKKMDYALAGVKPAGAGYDVKVKNRASIAAPFSLSGERDGKIEYTQWYEGFEGSARLNLPGGPYDRIAFDAPRHALELYRQNNHIRTSGLLKKVEPLEVKFLGRVENDRRTSLYWIPALARNNYDKTMIGLALYNTTIPARRFEYALAPMFAFGSGSLVGLGRLRYRVFPGGSAVREIVLDLGAKSFHFFRNEEFDYRLRYGRLTPSAELHLGNPGNAYTHRLRWRSILLGLEEARFDNGDFTGKDWKETVIHELSYAGESGRAPNPFSFRFAIEQQSYDDVFGDPQSYLKASLEWSNRFAYREKKYIGLRFFAGGFLHNTRREGGGVFPGAFNLVSQGYNDYRYDDYYFGREDRRGRWSQQVSIRDGGMKVAVDPAFNLGRSNNFIASFNLWADLPLPKFIPIKPYFDIGYFDNAMPTGQEDTFRDQLLWSGGLMLNFFNGIAGVYFPLVNSANIRDRFAERGNYFNRIAFHIDLNRLDPWRLVDEVREMW
jgi:hypothetical protein